MNLYHLSTTIYSKGKVQKLKLRTKAESYTEAIEKFTEAFRPKLLKSSMITYHRTKILNFNV